MERDDPFDRVPFARFVGECGALSRDEFVRRHPTPILFQLTEPGGASAREGVFTPVFGTISMLRHEVGAARSLWVHPVRKRGENPFSAMITIGRAANNDIVLPYEQVSKFHAFFIHTAAGLALVDAQSTNGTFLRGERLTANASRPLHGDVIDVSFAGVRAQVYSADALFDVVREHRFAAQAA